MSIKITFGIIVLNGEPFTRFCIDALYKHAHEIIISEGACPASASVAGSDGHSSDGTLEVLREIKGKHDPLNKITIVTAEDEGHENGFWPGEKDEQSRAYASRATGNVLWQVDIDEFYCDEDIERIIQLLENESKISVIGFRQIQFFFGFDYYVDTWYNKRHLKDIVRVFRWEKGYKYLKHRPPTVVDKEGLDISESGYLGGKATKKMGIYLYHYSYVLPAQVENKIKYYSKVSWSRINGMTDWYNNNYTFQKNPYRLFVMPEYPGWVKKFKGKHPDTIYGLIAYLKKSGTFTGSVNRLDKLTGSLLYNAGIWFLIVFEPVDRFLNFILMKLRRAIPGGIKDWLKKILKIK